MRQKTVIKNLLQSVKEVCYKVHQVLRSVSSITKCVRYYKVYILFSNLYLFQAYQVKTCSKFNLISFFIFISKYKALYEQNFIEHFSNKDLKTLHRQLY